MTFISHIDTDVIYTLGIGTGEDKWSNCGRIKTVYFIICLILNTRTQSFEQEKKIQPQQSRMRGENSVYYKFKNNVQYNLNGSNTDGSFTVDDSNSFFSPYKILPVAQENKYLGIFSYFIIELYFVCTP